MVNLYNRQEIADILQATICTNEGAAALAMELVDSPEKREVLQAYHRGVRHTLGSVGLAFGLNLDFQSRPKLEGGRDVSVGTRV